MKRSIHSFLVCTQSILASIKQTAHHQPTKGEAVSSVSCQKAGREESPKKKKLHCSFVIYSEEQLAE